ncbi:MAG: dTMP kinase [Pseudomonadota bacterium]
MKRGRFITFEGIEGVGKTTNIEHMRTMLEAQEIVVHVSREPGGTPLAEQIRDVLKAHTDEIMPAIAESLLMFASRSVHVRNKVEPALNAGEWVICDRFTDTSRAYQGAGRGLPESTIETLADWVHGDVNPDLTVLLDAPADIGMERAGRRGKLDRIESEALDFFERARQFYLDLAAQEPHRFIVIDATQSIEAVQQDIEALTHRLLSD